ncbi:MAG: 5'-nucleotidase C-terminal domain-containing protein [Limnohabitans sp.]|nr:5'-nucleotidase C-terminal domain-containing protein [Limnohabitans sp.]
MKFARSAFVACAAASVLAAGASAQSSFRLTILHTNDTESKLLYPSSSQQAYGGAARFKTKADALRAAADAAGGVVMVSSGDNYLAGPEFNASLSLPAGSRYYDSIALQAIGYDAICLGNHDFDFGPEVLANFINGFTDGTKFLSSNLDFSAEPSLNALVGSGRIAKRTTSVTDGVTIGFVGATTPDLPFISSPGDVVVNPNFAAAIQTEVDALTAAGVKHIVVMTHLQGISVERALASQLRDVDVLVAGGGDELLWNAGQLLVPDDAIDANNDGVPDARYGAYPLYETDANGRQLPIITTRGDYRYVGRCVVDFDANGLVTAVDPTSGPVRVASTAQADGVVEDAAVKAAVTDPVAASVAGLAANVIATSEVALDGRTSTIRAQETNEGNLCADSLLWNARLLAKGEGLPRPVVAFQNGGGIRNNSILPAGNFTELNTFQFLPFSNFAAIIPALPVPTFKALLENAVSRVQPPTGFPSSGNGRFAQIAGFRFTYSIAANPGSRVIDVVLDDGTVLVDDGVVLNPKATIAAATIDFLCRGGDEYPLTGLAFESIGVSYQQALYNYVVSASGLNGVISSADYPAAGEGRIVKFTPSSSFPADINGDGTVNALDVAIVLGNWGLTNRAGDANGNGIVEAEDLTIVLGNWSF